MNTITKDKIKEGIADTTPSLKSFEEEQMASTSSPTHQDNIILRYYFDEIKLNLPLCIYNDANKSLSFSEIKAKIDKPLKKLHVDKEVVVDKSTETFQALRIPSMGIVIETNSRNGLSLNIIFKGSYFTIGTTTQQRDTLKVFIQEYCKEFSVFPILSKIDICCDVANFKMKDFDYRDYHYAFRARVIPYYNTQTEELETCYIRNQLFDCVIYNKKAENQQQKNKRKQEYYNEKYADYEDIVRIETRLKNSITTKKYTQALLESDDWEDLSKRIMRDFGSKRRIYKKRAKTNGKETLKKNRNRDLEEWSVWKEVISQEVKKEEIPLTPNLKAKERMSSFKNIKNFIIETNIAQGKNLTKEELKNFIENNFEEIKEKTLERQKERQLHSKEVEKIQNSLHSLEGKQAT